MIKTVRTCDACGKEITGAEFTTITVTVNGWRRPPFEVHICAECLPLESVTKLPNTRDLNNIIKDLK